MKTQHISLVLTSCNRFDLLERTLDSFFKFNSYPIAQYIIIEDSHNREKIEKVLSKFPDINFTLICNEPQLGQMKSIDKAYSAVTSDYIFHCEDDWEFYRSGFIEDSLNVLKSNDKIITVWLREQDDTNEHPVEPEIHSCDNELDTPYQLMKCNHKRRENSRLWHGFTFNPGLRRLKDYQMLSPIGDIGGELEMSELYYKHGFKAAIFPQGYVKHIGDHRGIRYSIYQSKFIKDASVYIRKIKATLCKILKI